MGVTSNIDTVLAEAEGRLARAMDRRPAFDAMHDLFLARRKWDFITQGASTEHGRWAPLRPATLRKKLRRHGRVRSILVDSERLLDSLSRASHPDHLYVASRERILAMGTRVPYAILLQSGTRRMPPRRPIDPATVEREAYAEILGTWIVEGRVLREPGR